MLDVRNKNCALIADEAQVRGIEITSFPGLSRVIMRLKFKEHTEFIAESGSNTLGVVMYKIFLNKALTDELLQQGGFKVPAEVATDNIEEAEQFLAELGKVVVKPLNLTWGKGVTTNITTNEGLKEAFKRAQVEVHGSRSASVKVICQQQLLGEEYRVLVVNGSEVFAVQRIPANVIGDGKLSIEQLVEEQNKMVLESRVILINERVIKLLNQQGFKSTDVPTMGQQVWLRQIANAHAGGTVRDVTDELGEETKKEACRVAQYFGVSMVGIDCFADDLGKKLGSIIELNGTPDITLHHMPTVGQSRNVAGVIVDMLFPETR